MAIKKLPADDISPTFCIMPWSAIATTPAGGYKPCCRIESSGYTGSIDSYHNSDYLNGIKSASLSGKFHRECIRCQQEEKSGVYSKRKRENQRWLINHNKKDFNDFENYPIVDLDLRLSNKCNLLCISCSPISSSSIFNEVHKNNNTLDHYKKAYHNVVDHDIDLSNSYTNNELDKLVNLVNEKSSLYFTGGEPSLVKPAFDILSTLIDRGLNKHVKLTFNSNFQSFNKKWIDLLSHFSGTMMPSIDAVGKSAEFIRYGCVWNTVEKNVVDFFNTCDSYTICITPAVSILNIFELHNLVNWTRQFNSPRVIIDFTNRVNTPRMLCVRNLPTHAKIDAISYIENLVKSNTTVHHEKKTLAELITYIKQPSLLSKIDFVSEMDKLDKIRNTNWRQELPELSKYYEH